MWNVILLIEFQIKRNLSWNTTDESLREAFQQFGQITDAVSWPLRSFSLTLPSLSRCCEVLCR